MVKLDPTGPDFADGRIASFTLPVMVVWSVSTTLYVPATTNNLGADVAPGASVPVSNSPIPDLSVAVCWVVPTFFHCTHPANTDVAPDGEYDESLIEMVRGTTDHLSVATAPEPEPFVAWTE